MDNVFRGIVVEFIGLVIWFGVSVVYGVGLGFGGGQNPVFEGLVFQGFLLMVGGPVVYIVVIPIVNWWRRRRSRGNRVKLGAQGGAGADI